MSAAVAISLKGILGNPSVVACNMMFLDCGVQSTPDWIRPVSF